MTSDVTSEASSPLSNKMASCDFRSAAMMDWTDGANSSVVSTGSYTDDVSVPEIEWAVMGSSSPDTPYPVSGLPLQSGMAGWWSTAVTTYPAPDAVPSLKHMKPEVVTFDFRSAAMMDCTDEGEQSFVSTGRSGNSDDDVTVPEITRDMMTSLSPNMPVSKAGVSEWWPTGFITYPSPDPIPETESIPGYRKPFSIYNEWLAPDASPHDQWLEASYSTTNEDSRPHQIYHSADKLNDCNFLYQQQHYGSFPDQSLGGVIYDSLEGASGVCWPYDNDYIDDVLSVMAKAANNSRSMTGLA